MHYGLGVDFRRFLNFFRRRLSVAGTAVVALAQIEVRARGCREVWDSWASGVVVVVD